MIRREIELDEETDRDLAKLAQDYDGNLNEAVVDLLHVRESIEDFLDQCEDSHGVSLRQQIQNSERDFRNGRTVSWAEVKRRNNL